MADWLRPGDFAGRADFGGSGGDFAGAGLYRCRAAALQKIGGVLVKIVVVKSPKALRGILTLIFGVKE